MTTGWKLTGECREALLAAHPPRYERVVADHVTLSISGTQLPAEVHVATIIGRTDDGSGVEALVVVIEGSTIRPDGKTWHITWSLAEGRSARESNDAIAKFGWQNVSASNVQLMAALW
ncbi:hypothetical protein GGQ88_001482 [Novosphingobium hassiacum]|uniref:Uncharacterized protein n=1 Tax=Novosphingobium hassiacum TaxID=173676 RepID=A0A7W5ZVF3_9SPHN|nr:hypothetical protein [Novosphingobium hassiacum]MBB3860216.1 hypothetical protein [Novosphingobium hassiacum]